MKIVTGKTGTAHVTSVDDRMLHQYIFGEDGILGMSRFPELVDSTTIRIYPCDIMFQGCHARILEGQYEDLTFDSGVTGQKRIDLVVARYNMDEDGLESMSLKIIKGESVADSQDPQIPAYQHGDINNGSWLADMPLVRIDIDGLSVSDPALIAKNLPNMTDKYDKSETYSREEVDILHKEIKSEIADIGKEIVQLNLNDTDIEVKVNNAQNTANDAISAAESAAQVAENASSAADKATKDIKSMDAYVGSIADSSIVLTGISGVTVTIPGTNSTSPVTSATVTFPAKTSRVFVVPKTIPEGVTYMGYEIAANQLNTGSGEYVLTVRADNKNKADANVVVVAIGVARVNQLVSK